MNHAYHHERHEMYHNPMTACPPSRLLSPRSLHLLALLVALLVSDATAAPISAKAGGKGSLFIRADNASMAPTQIWVPIFVVAMIIFAIAILVWSKGSRFNLRRFFIPGVTGQTSTTTLASAGAREVTAEQLAGDTANNNTSRPRRSRRPRRTPSQISTTSLPAYNKEPGEEELVIFRGQEAEDVTVQTTIVMPALQEDHDGESSVTSEATSRYSPVPSSPNNMPLLDEHRQESGDTPNGSDAALSLRREDSNPIDSPDPRGEAPAYFEFVAPETSEGTPSANDTPPGVTQSRSSPPTSPQRRSGFRTFLHAFGNSNHTTAPNSIPLHQRTESSPSVVSSEAHQSRTNLQSRTSHRPTPSGSSSVLTSSVFRTISRQKSSTTLNNIAGNLNSPSLISLNSISSPLTHTLVRTEFTYPKAGPTPEQLKLISSRESFVRFGVPYGPDAIAYAASASRQDLGPPPDFDAIGSETHLPRPTVSPTNAEGTTSDQSSLEADEAPHPSLPLQSPAGPSEPTAQTGGELGEVLATPKVPPTSFKGPTASFRSESRASSYSIQSYATAAESLAAGAPTNPDAGVVQTTTLTPNAGHTLEPTDGTIIGIAV